MARLFDWSQLTAKTWLPVWDQLSAKTRLFFYVRLFTQAWLCNKAPLSAFTLLSAKAIYYY